MQKRTDFFCISPWIQLHVFPDGRVFPCCWSAVDDSYALGNLSTDSIESIINNKATRQLRASFKSGIAPKTCEKCVKVEGDGGVSYRQDLARRFHTVFKEAELTPVDGYVQDFKFRFMDIRFSNVCNFKCRTCGPLLSSSWGQERLLGPRSLIDLSQLKYDPTPFILEQLSHVSEIYFAGGEPLLMKQHYQILERLIEIKRTDIFLKYSTNLSVLQFGKTNILELWKHFKNVEVAVSLDGEGQRAEYLRKGTVWSSISENLQRMRKDVPHVKILIAGTISAYNFLHWPDFISNWLNLGLLGPQEFFASRLYDPPEYDLNVLPPVLKRQGIQKWKEFRNKIAARSSSEARNCEFTMSTLDQIITSCTPETEPHDLRERLCEAIKYIDQVRGESILAVFPELNLLFE